VLSKILIEEFPQYLEMIEIVAVDGKGLFPAYEKFLSALQIPSSTIADFDYLKQVGDSGIKALFPSDKNRIARDVIANPKSRDGEKLVELFEDSIKTGRWQGTEEMWKEIVTSRLGSLGPITTAQRRAILKNISKLNAAGTHILKRGAIEDYLPAGHRSKDIDKLVGTLEKGALRAIMSPGRFSELRSIMARCVER
jgi:hypothetical protein